MYISLCDPLPIEGKAADEGGVHFDPVVGVIYCWSITLSSVIDSSFFTKQSYRMPQYIFRLKNALSQIQKTHL